MALNTGASESMLSYLCSDCELIEGGEFLQEKDLYPFLTLCKIYWQGIWDILEGRVALSFPALKEKLNSVQPKDALDLRPRVRPDTSHISRNCDLGIARTTRPRPQREARLWPVSRAPVPPGFSRLPGFGERGRGEASWAGLSQNPGRIPQLCCNNHTHLYNPWPLGHVQSA